MKYFSLAFAILLPQLAHAAGGHHGDGVPTTVIYQAINLAILFGGIIYFTKDSAVQFFKARHGAYLDAAEKSAAARKEAEKNLADVKSRLDHVLSTKDQAILKAQQQAEELKANLAAEAEAAVKRIRSEAELTAKLEIQRARKELQEKLVKDSIDAARVVLTKDIGGADHAKLQGEFVKNVEVHG